MNRDKQVGKATSVEREGTKRLRTLPSVDNVMAQPPMAEVRSQLPHAVVVDAARAEVDAAREALLKGDTSALDLHEIAGRAVHRAWIMTAPSLRAVINATGVVIHTNLG